MGIPGSINIVSYDEILCLLAMAKWAELPVISSLSIRAAAAVVSRILNPILDITVRFISASTRLMSKR